MLSFFKKVDEATKQQQIQAIAEKAAAAAAATAAAAKQQYELLKPGPGRPRIPTSLIPPLPDPCPDPEPSSKRPKRYQDWFLSDVTSSLMRIGRQTIPLIELSTSCSASIPLSTRSSPAPPLIVGSRKTGRR